MIKRLVWLTLGITVGVLAVLRTQRSLRRRADRLRPERMATDLADAIRAWASTCARPWPRVGRP